MHLHVDIAHIKCLTVLFACCSIFFSFFFAWIRDVSELSTQTDEARIGHNNWDETHTHSIVIQTNRRNRLFALWYKTCARHNGHTHTHISARNISLNGCHFNGKEQTRKRALCECAHHSGLITLVTVQWFKVGTKFLLAIVVAVLLALSPPLFLYLVLYAVRIVICFSVRCTIHIFRLL